jgi:mycothiol synthase
LLNIRSFVKGQDEEMFVRAFNACFADYDDLRCMTLEEMKKAQEAPSYSSEGVLIAEWNREPAGMVDAYIDKQRDDRKGFIQSLAILPEYRRKGIGKRLVEMALKSLKQRGMRTVEAWAQSDREGCTHIYESFGFTQVRITSMMKRNLETIPRDIGENMDVVMRGMRTRDDADIELLNRLDNETFKEHNNFRPRTIEETKYTLFEIPWFTRQAWFFAELNNQTVGYTGSAIDEGLNKEKNLKWGMVADIGVLKPYRRQGVGTRLMLQAMQTLKDMEVEDALLYVDEMNPTKAIKLYEKLGFKVATKNIIYQLQLN